MLKVYNVYDYVSIDGAKWRTVGGYGGYRIADEEVETTLVLDNVSFEDAREYLSHNLLDGVWNDSTLFRNKPIVVVSYQDAWDPVSYRHFNTLSYKREFKEWNNVTFEWLTTHLSADQVIQYLKERGITTCPMNF
jgi:hypothetical protein